MKKVLIFGSTGSIGKSALDVIRTAGKHFKVTGLCAHSDVTLLARQAKEFKPQYICIVNEAKAVNAAKLFDKKVKLFVGERGLEEFASLTADVSVMAISGISCLKPLYRNIASVKRVALANKEAIVAAGPFIFKHAARHKTEIIPVDSEINSLFQLFGLGRPFRRVHLTASGGALFGYTQRQLSRVKASQVLDHPTWSMGKRITVDSATLVNKAFEVIETHRFFDIDYKDIEVVIHRQSYVHAMVQTVDGTVFNCVYPPDMKVPIRHSLYYPDDADCGSIDPMQMKLNFTFEPLKPNMFPAFDMVIDAARKGDNMPVIANACDEVAVEAFLQGRIRFTDIVRVIEGVLNKARRTKMNALEDVFYWDMWGRNTAEAQLTGK